MKPAIEIFLDTKGQVTVNGSIEDDHLNLQLLLKAAEAVNGRMAQQARGGILSDIRAPLELVRGNG